MRPTHRPPPTARSRTAPASSLPFVTTCPHCGQSVDARPLVEAILDRIKAEELDQLVVPWRELVAAITSRVLPAGFGGNTKQEQPEGSKIALSRPQVIGLLLATLVAILIVAMLWWVWPQGGATGAVAPAPTPAIAPSAQAGHTAAIIETLSGYNRAETEAAALLTIEPLIPFIDPTSPFAERRAGQIAERRQRAMPHRSVLVRWAIGAVDVRGATATVVTQETWSNQEAGAVAAEQATVRVSYTLRQDLATGRWLIVESSQMPL
jgi:hypothetical protein